MKTITHICLGDNDVGDVEGFFDEAGNLIHSWAMNDASWRSEYMDPLLEKLGIRVVGGDSKELEAKLKEHWRD